MASNTISSTSSINSTTASSATSLSLEKQLNLARETPLFYKVFALASAGIMLDLLLTFTLPVPLMALWLRHILPPLHKAHSSYQAAS